MKWGKKASQLTVRCLACFHLANQTDHRMSQGAARGHLPPSWGSPHWFATQPWLFHMFRCHWGNFSLGKRHNKKIQLCFNQLSVNPQLHFPKRIIRQRVKGEMQKCKEQRELCKKKLKEEQRKEREKPTEKYDNNQNYYCQCYCSHQQCHCHF